MHLVFTALHEIQTRSRDEKALRLSVCPSVRRLNCDKMVQRSVQIFIPNERSFSLVFEKNGWWDAAPLPQILGHLAHVGAKSSIFNRFSPVTPQP